MKRFALYLTKKQVATLEKISHKDGLSIAEIIRRAVDSYLANYGVK